MRQQDDLWVFGYGSLMWRPDFPFLERHTARLFGYHRSLCIYSQHHRGTPERPGLVLGLDRGGSCVGRVYRVAAEEAEAVIAYLDHREMVTAAYRPLHHPVHLPDGRVLARAYIVDPGHPQYAGRLPLDEQARIILRAAPGQSGINRDYLESTVLHLDELGIADGPLHRVWEMLKD